MIRKLLFFFFLLIISTSFSQERKPLYGVIKDSLGVVKNSNIINIKTNKGTFSFDDGTFKIFAKEGDSLKVSSIQHQEKIIVIKKNSFGFKKLVIYLQPKVYELDEFELKKHNLTGRLGIDTKNVPIDRRDSLLNKLMDFSKIDMKVVEGDDYIDKRVRPQIVNTVANSFTGAGAKMNTPFKHSERLWALRKKLARQKEFPSKILSQLGEDFFFEKLKIPVENYFHFLEYCNPLGIENMHKEGKILELIKILQVEGVSYLKMIKKD